jgi:DNA repair protein RecO (recombination protein O)
LAAEKAIALVVRTTDWSETSRIVTLWTREFGRVRGLAKGGRRLKSNFDSALDLLTVCSIVLLRKSSGSLDLLTEAQVVRRFPRLRTDLAALYAAYYIAELLADWTEDYDPHPIVFDEALAALDGLGAAEAPATGLRLARFELVLLRELGYSPALDRCAVCGRELPLDAIAACGDGFFAFSAAAGGLVCPACAVRQRDRRPIANQTREALLALMAAAEGGQRAWDPATRKQIRQILGQYVTYLMGRQPRLLPYLGS